MRTKKEKDRMKKGLCQRVKVDSEKFIAESELLMEPHPDEIAGE